MTLFLSQAEIKEKGKQGREMQGRKGETHKCRMLEIVVELTAGRGETWKKTEPNLDRERMPLSW